MDIKSKRDPAIGKEKELYLVELGTNTASRSVIYYPILVLIVVMVLTLAAVLSGMRVRTEFNNKDFLPNDWESLETQIELEEAFNGSSVVQAYILLEATQVGINSNPNGLATLNLLQGLQDIEYNIANDKYIVNINGNPRIESVLYHVQEAIKYNLTLASMVDENYDYMPDDDNAVKIVFDYLYQSHDLNLDNSVLSNSLIHSDIDKILYRDQSGIYRSTLVRVYVNVKNSHEVREMHSELKDDMVDVYFKDIKKSATGNVILTVTTMDSLQDSQVMSTIISIIFALIILIVIYRNLVLGLIAITPVLISSMWILGTMYFLSISINVFTVSITALTIGLGIDYAIHIIERFREESKRFSTDVAIQRTIRSTGSALFISALTTVCGFFVLIISPIPPIQHFGLITAMTIIYSSILALVVIPILLIKWSGWSGASKKIED